MKNGSEETFLKYTNKKKKNHTNTFAANSRIGTENKKRKIILQMSSRNQSSDAISSYCAKENRHMRDIRHIRDYTKIVHCY